jgi:hypothetical protein
MNVRFYLPAAHLPSAENRAAWLQGEDVVLEQEGKIAAAQSWIYRTWIALVHAGSRVELVHELPDDGAVIALAGTLSPQIQNRATLFVAAVAADGLPHAAADLHILQNAAHARRMPRSVFQPHWPQPGLLRRDDKRGETFRSVAFFGTGNNLAPELQTPGWAEALSRETGCVFEIRGAERWHDYSDVDAVIAVRDFRGGRQLHKPATKLYNAWLAGVPFIGGSDSAYAAEGSPGRDYLVARSPEEVLSHLRKLKHNPSLRASLVGQGMKKGTNYTVEAVTERWRKLVEETIPEAAARRARRAPWLNRCRAAAMRGVCAADRIFRS